MNANLFNLENQMYLVPHELDRKPFTLQKGYLVSIECHSRVYLCDDVMSFRASKFISSSLWILLLLVLALLLLSNWTYITAPTWMTDSSIRKTAAPVWTEVLLSFKVSFNTALCSSVTLLLHYSAINIIHCALLVVFLHCLFQYYWSLGHHKWITIIILYFFFIDNHIFDK